MALIDFTLSNARRFYSSMGNPLEIKGLNVISFPQRAKLGIFFHYINMQFVLPEGYDTLLK